MHLSAVADEIKMKVTKRYLNLPVSHNVERSGMEIISNGQPSRKFNIRLAPQSADYWVFSDLSEYLGETITIRYDGPSAGLKQLEQSDEIKGHDSLYREHKRPQFHFTTKRGWINDPNGLIFHDGEYHLFYQHNPYEREWENMHWGHAVSKDLMHWKELPTALYPDSTGTMFSGSAIIDYENAAGYNENGKSAMIVAYTAASEDRQIQCIAYSLDKGRTFRKYEDNPVIDSKEKWNSVDTRDPRLFWYEPGEHWVMLLNERDGHSIYTSKDLKAWEYQSHVTGFWECPDLFELMVDGDPNNKKWVMYGASNTYMIGDFDGKKFTPESGKHYFVTGSIYAAQTFSNIPESDGRRIQIGWGRISHEGMPFNGMMLLPTQLELKKTGNGTRLFSQPVREVEQLFNPVKQWKDIEATEANRELMNFSEMDGFRLKTTIRLSHATSAGISLNGQKILDYDMNNNRINGVFYSPDDMTSMEISADVFIDRSSVEVFIDGGAYSYSLQREASDNNRAKLEFWGNQIEVPALEIFEAKSIWQN